MSFGNHSLGRLQSSRQTLKLEGSQADGQLSPWKTWRAKDLLRVSADQLAPSIVRRFLAIGHWLGTGSGSWTGPVSPYRSSGLGVWGVWEVWLDWLRVVVR